jgi:hypothetical protein
MSGIKIRLVVYAAFFAIVVFFDDLLPFTEAVIRYFNGDPDVVSTCVFGAFVLVIIIDSSYHSWKGEGQACKYCGHLRKMKPFRVYGKCPECGELG